MDANDQKQITAALAAHGQWKARLRTAIAEGKCDLTVTIALRDDQCAFGKWLHGEASPELRSSAHYSSCKQLHAEFHRAAGEVLQLALAGKKAEAEAKLASGTPFTGTSMKLTLELSNWLKAA